MYMCCNIDFSDRKIGLPKSWYPNPISTDGSTYYPVLFRYPFGMGRAAILRKLTRSPMKTVLMCYNIRLEQLKKDAHANMIDN
jgi:hypothetical protein